MDGQQVNRSTGQLSSVSIQSFACPDTEGLFTTGQCRRFVNVKSVAERNGAQLDAAHSCMTGRQPRAAYAVSPRSATLRSARAAVARQGATVVDDQDRRSAVRFATSNLMGRCSGPGRVRVFDLRA